MQFLKTLFWVMIAVIAAIFSYNNWIRVPIVITSSVPMLEINLPLLLLITFLLGMLPTFLLHRATRWSMRRKLDTAERALSDIREAAPAAKSVAVSAVASPPEVA